MRKRQIIEIAEEQEEEKDCLELGIDEIDDICLNFQTFLLGFASFGFCSPSPSLTLF